MMSDSVKEESKFARQYKEYSVLEAAIEKRRVALKLTLRQASAAVSLLSDQYVRASVEARRIEQELRTACSAAGLDAQDMISLLQGRIEREVQQGRPGR